MVSRIQADTTNVTETAADHCGTRVEKPSGEGLSGMCFWLICNDNPLAVYQLSGKLSPVTIINLGPGQLK
jgi:hypothetical protein